MPLWSRKKVPAAQEREHRLRQIRADAPTIRSTCPGVTLVHVQLKFVPDSAFPHAAQSFQFYPAARAVFSFPCPYGDCDGIYDLRSEAEQTLSREKPRVTGTAKCGGLRARDGQPRQPCGLSVRYTISAQHEPVTAE